MGGIKGINPLSLELTLKLFQAQIPLPFCLIEDREQYPEQPETRFNFDKPQQLTPEQQSDIFMKLRIIKNAALEVFNQQAREKKT